MVLEIHIVCSNMVQIYYIIFDATKSVYINFSEGHE